MIAIAITIAVNGANELRDAELRLARLRGGRDPVGPEGPRPVMTPARRFTGASRETVQKARETQAPLVVQYRKELQVLQKQLLTAKAIASSSEDNAQASLANVQLKAAQARVDAKLLDIQNAQGILNLNPSQFKTAAEQQRASMPSMVPGETPGTGKPPKEKSLESYYSLQDQLAKNFTQDQLDRMEQEYQARVNRINSEFDLREARANSFQKEAIRFERQISDIELKRQKALLDASAEVIKAQGSVAGGAGGQSTTGATGLLQGSTGISSGAHFDVRRQDGSYISPEQAKALFDPSVRRQLAMTSAYGPRRAPVPGASTFHKGVDLAGPANTPLNLAP
ncbi:MAG: M23 family metallopeptidase, partial [Zwartia sp.]